MKKICALSLLISVLACADTKVEDRPAGAPTDSAAVDQTGMTPDTGLSDAPRAQAPTQFNPQQVKAGDAFGDLKVAEAKLQPAQTDSKVSGSVRFEGQVEVAGNYRAHFDYPEVKAPCFWVNVESWPKLPRAAGDTRLIWFCFENDQEAIKQLGALGTQSRATILIDNYTTHITGSDAWDTARLVRVVEKRGI